jgi:hypothetical protein
VDYRDPISLFNINTGSGYHRDRKRKTGKPSSVLSIRSLRLFTALDPDCLLINPRISLLAATFPPPLPLSFPRSLFLASLSFHGNPLSPAERNASRNSGKLLSFRRREEDPLAGSPYSVPSRFPPVCDPADTRRDAKSPGTQCGTDWLARLSVVH